MDISEGQFDDACPSSLPAVGHHRHRPSTTTQSSGESSDDECWEMDLACCDWQTETGDFTKKLNAVRFGQAGTNSQQGKGKSTPSQKALQVNIVH